MRKELTDSRTSFAVMVNNPSLRNPMSRLIKRKITLITLH
jgi:hypothetical protein